MWRLELCATVQELHDTTVITSQMLDGVIYQQLVAAVEKMLAVDDFFIFSRVSLKVFADTGIRMRKSRKARRKKKRISMNETNLDRRNENKNQ